MEKFERLEYTSPLYERITNLRTQVNRDADTVVAFLDAVYVFHHELLRDLGALSMDTNVRSVPEWHNLVGSTPEFSHMESQVRDYILERIEEFVSAWEQRIAAL